MSQRQVLMRPIRAILATAVAVLATLPLAGDARATGYRHTHLQANLCGNACNDGGLTVVSDLVNSIERRGPYSVTVNEVCENQYDKLRTDLPAYYGRFDPTGEICHNGARYGNVILSRTDLTLVGSWELPNPARDELRYLMCVNTQLLDGRPLTVCVTHISNESGNIAAQVSTVATILSGLKVSGATLVGGDFNANPYDTRMNPMYSTCYSSGAGTFREVDSGDECRDRSTINLRVGSDVINEETYGNHKFDYIFFSGGWLSADADAVKLELSDHDALWATAQSPPG